MVGEDLQLFDLNFIHKLLHMASKDGFGHLDSAFIFFDIVNADESTAFHNTDNGSGDRSLHTLINRQIQRQSDHRFTGSSKKHWNFP